MVSQQAEIAFPYAQLPVLGTWKRVNWAEEYSSSLPLPGVQCLGRSVLREASDALLSRGCAASWSLHIHPDHLDNCPSFYQPLKVSFFQTASLKFSPPPIDSRPPSRAPGKAESCSRLRPLQLPVFFGWGGPEQVYVYLHVLAAEETKENHLHDNKTPSSTNWRTRGPLGLASTIRPEASPLPVSGGVCKGSGKLCLNRPGLGWGGGLREPYQPPRPGRRGSIFQ